VWGILLHHFPSASTPWATPLPTLSSPCLSHLSTVARGLVARGARRGPGSLPLHRRLLAFPGAAATLVLPAAACSRWSRPAVRPPYAGVPCIELSGGPISSGSRAVAPARDASMAASELGGGRRGPQRLLDAEGGEGGAGSPWHPRPAAEAPVLAPTVAGPIGLPSSTSPLQHCLSRSHRRRR
jgi:hypothetical protein